MYKAAAFSAVGTSASLALIPIENSLHGAVIEALDLLRDPRVGRSMYVRGQISFTINHSLVVQRGKAIGDITSVHSHEQVGN